MAHRALAAVMAVVPQPIRAIPAAIPRFRINAPVAPGRRGTRGPLGLTVTEETQAPPRAALLRSGAAARRSPPPRSGTTAAGRASMSRRARPRLPWPIRSWATTTAATAKARSLQGDTTFSGIRRTAPSRRRPATGRVSTRISADLGTTAARRGHWLHRRTARRSPPSRPISALTRPTSATYRGPPRKWARARSGPTSRMARRSSILSTRGAAHWAAGPWLRCAVMTSMGPRRSPSMGRPLRPSPPPQMAEASR